MFCQWRIYYTKYTGNTLGHWIVLYIFNIYVTIASSPEKPFYIIYTTEITGIIYYILLYYCVCIQRLLRVFCVWVQLQGALSPLSGRVRHHWAAAEEEGGMEKEEVPGRNYHESDGGGG